MSDDCVCSSSCSSSDASPTTTSLSSFTAAPSDDGGDKTRYDEIRTDTDKFVQQLIRDKQNSQTLLRAWSERCRTLEDEVRRLVLVCADLERKQQDARTSANTRQKAETEADAPAAYLSNHVSPDAAPQRQLGLTTTCAWTGRDWQPVSANGRLQNNKPRIDPTKSMSRQSPPPCNAFYLRNHCGVPRCKFSHEYELTPEQVEEMRRGAKFHICNATRNGLECGDPDCVYGHVCPKGNACPRTNCSFNDQQHLVQERPPAFAPPGAVSPRRRMR
ncbi:hypothetical protein ACM66B_005193 [Microbotryomycetes sp. NB124-2]